MLYERARSKSFPKFAASLFVCSCSLSIAASALAQESCFERLDNGVDMTGWERSTTNHHGPGEGWSVEDGAFVGRQTAGQQGGILMTDGTYSDVEVVLEVKIDWGCDSGIFFRTTGGDKAYQVNVDHLMGAGIGTIYGEGFTTELRARDYTLTDQGNTAVVEPGHTPIFDLGTWSTIWHPTEFNEIRARVEGNPPHIQVWISDVKVMDFTDTQLRAEIEPVGPLAIQVHSGGRWVDGGTVRYRNIRVRDLTVACEEPIDAGPLPGDPDAAVGGAGGSSGAGGAQTGGGTGGVGGVQANGGASGDSVGGTGSGGEVPGGSGGGAGAVEPPTDSSDGDSGGCTFTASEPREATITAWFVCLLALVGLRRLRLMTPPR